MRDGERWVIHRMRIDNTWFTGSPTAIFAACHWRPRMSAPGQNQGSSRYPWACRARRILTRGATTQPPSLLRLPLLEETPVPDVHSSTTTSHDRAGRQGVVLRGRDAQPKAHAPHKESSTDADN